MSVKKLFILLLCIIGTACKTPSDIRVAETPVNTVPIGPPTITQLPISSLTAPPASTPTNFPSLTPPITLTPIPTPAERLAFQAGSLAFINSDGSGFEQPLWFQPYFRHDVAGIYLAFSPDGRYLAFDGVSELKSCNPESENDCVSGDYGLFLADLQNETISRLSNMQTNPTWSPDSRYIVVGGSNLVKWDVTNGTSERLTDGGASDIYPAWSPTRDQIAFIRYVQDPEQCSFPLPGGREFCNHGSLYLIRPDGTELNLLIESVYVDDYYYQAPLWLPNGQWLITFVGETQPDLVLVNVQTGEVELLAPDPARDFAPALSPDGSKITFASNRDGDYDIYVVSIDGSELTNLTNNENGDFMPIWSLTRNQIAFASNLGGGGHWLYQMNADGTGLTLIYKTELLLRPSWFIPQP